jgi:outer membrane protein assembly factor BamB
VRARLIALLSLPAAALLLALGSRLRGAPGDWPAWRGPERTGVSAETGLLKEWPKGGPKRLWKITGLGDGHSTVSVAGGRIYVLGTEDGSERLFALSARDGKRLWAADLGAGGQSRMGGMARGPLSTPTVDGERVYALSTAGRLVCACADKGKVLWTKNLRKDFGGVKGMFGYSESPLVDGDKLIVTPGGDKATLVALNKKTGEVIWRSAVTGLVSKGGKGFGGPGKFGKGGRFPGRGKGGFGGMGGFGAYNAAGYASPVVVEVNKTRQYVQFLTGGVVGVSAKDGKLLWNYDAPSSGMANCSTVLFKDDSVFAASGYGRGGGRAKLTVNDKGKWKAEQAYFVERMVNQHGGMVLVGDHVYGANESQLLCVDFKTGEVAWRARAAGKGSVVAVDGMIIHRGEDGTVCLVEANPKGYKERGKFKQPDRSSQMAWPHPVVAGGKLYLRDADTLLCYDLKSAAK